MKLYEITGAMAEVQQMIEDGVPLEHLEDTLNEIKVDFKEKAEACLFALANIDAEMAACKSEEERLAARRTSKAKQKDHLKEYLLFNMEKLNSGKIDNGVMTASVRKGAPKLQINNEAAIPEQFKKISVSSAVDKKELLKAIKALAEGELIDGAEMIQGSNTLTVK